MDLSKNTSSKSVFLYTLPILISSILEEIIIFTDSVFLSFKDPIFLSTVGIIDSVYLIFLAAGESLNDAYQNYFARTLKLDKCVPVWKKGLPTFILYAFLSTFLLYGFYALSSLAFSNNIHYKIFGETIPYVIVLIFLTYISLWLNSCLMGLGRTKVLAIISVISIFVNAIVGAWILFFSNLPFNPCCAILIGSISAEFLAICLMLVVTIKINASRNSNNKYILLKRIINIINASALYPVISNMVFHIGSLLLYIFCIYFLPTVEVALFTLFMSYWGILQVSTESFAETSLNYFASLHSSHNGKRYYSLKKNIYKAALSVISIFFISLILFDVIVYEYSINRVYCIMSILFIVLLNLNMTLVETSLFVRLKTDVYLQCKLLYGTSFALFAVIGILFVDAGVLTVLVSFVIAQLICCVYLKAKERIVWTKLNSNEN